jgi:PhnB protein
MQLEPYLSFNGNCEEALSFYSKIFNGHITVMNRYEASPFAAQLPPERLKQVIHARFRAPSIRFLASDRYESYPEESRISLSIATPDNAEAERLFAALGEGGAVDVPLSSAPWGGRFGMLTDRYGVDWMVSYTDDNDLVPA